MTIQHPNPQVRDFLLFGSFTLFMQAGLSGRLKFISVLYALQLHEDCEWFLDELDEEYIKIVPAFCFCRFLANDMTNTTINMYMYNTSSSGVVTCICFLPSELIITPHGMKYEMFRHFGISLEEDVRANTYNHWHYRAVVDCNTFFFFLKYLLKKNLEKDMESNFALRDLITLVAESTNVKHFDVGCNLIASCFCSWAPSELLKYLGKSWSFLTCSWEEMICNKFSSSLYLCDLKQTQNQFNAAKWHALVLLYNTWFARKPPGINFCFKCLKMTFVKLHTCSMCHIATYCSPQCQFDNWEIHNDVCKLVRRIQ
ncbi:unnamed protein product [Mytilus coruscus]|uniref:MYND-type domain-containing protein n=1 Tax=Mytilus coruscus TaxID=42192 RepID=A0A6J8ADC2_MYTCO|nr:unnamed protein product [Mytilus coruscus]